MNEFFNRANIKPAVIFLPSVRLARTAYPSGHSENCRVRGRSAGEFSYVSAKSWGRCSACCNPTLHKRTASVQRRDELERIGDHMLRTVGPIDYYLLNVSHVIML